jgi:SAM-dependent methyltransferase
MIAPITEAVFARARISKGETIIDIGCGPGATSIEMAKIVGANGRVLAVDFSEPFIDVARGRANQYAQKPEFVCADASQYAFAGANADLVFSRFGVMFFDDPTAAFVNIRLGVKTGGRLAFVCWRSLPENEWLAAPLAIAAKHLPPVDPMPENAPGPFAFSDPSRVQTLLSASGFQDVLFEPDTREIAIAGGAAEAVDFYADFGPVADRLRETDESVKAAIFSDLEGILSAHEKDGAVHLGAAVWIVTAIAA